MWWIDSQPHNYLTVSHSVSTVPFIPDILHYYGQSAFQSVSGSLIQSYTECGAGCGSAEAEKEHSMGPICAHWHQSSKNRPGDKPTAVGGAAGLYLRSGSKIGTEKFTLRFVSPATGKRRDMGSGTYSAIGLANARTAAIRAQQLIAQRIDPTRASS
ncbi:Arm DNA-binding domain-containing protein [Sulfitobacter sp. MF3-043]|uniref:Arm DNA-binding domain-containing protein n=1 Tax=Sulfitobacter sediminivivens TaxID=3252902 RepID=UPI003EB7B326